MPKPMTHFLSEDGEVCEICGCDADFLTYDCPGFKINPDTLVLVGRMRVDYVDGEWINLY